MCLFATSLNIENICFNWFVVFSHALLCVCVVLTCSSVVFVAFAVYTSSTKPWQCRRAACLVEATEVWLPHLAGISFYS